MGVKKVLIILNILCLIASLIWLMVEHSWEPLISTIGLVASLITLLSSNNDGNGKISMKQKGGKNSTNYQAGGNINF